MGREAVQALRNFLDDLKSVLDEAFGESGALFLEELRPYLEAARSDVEAHFLEVDRLLASEETADGDGDSERESSVSDRHTDFQSRLKDAGLQGPQLQAKLEGFRIAAKAFREELAGRESPERRWRETLLLLPIPRDCVDSCSNENAGSGRRCAPSDS